MEIFGIANRNFADNFSASYHNSLMLNIVNLYAVNYAKVSTRQRWYTTRMFATHSLWCSLSLVCIFRGTLTLFSQIKEIRWAVIFENSYNTATYKKRHTRSMQVTKQVEISNESVVPWWIVIQYPQPYNGKIPWKFERTAVEGHPKSMILVPIESAYMSSY